MTIKRDARFALAVLVGKVDRSDPAIPARLAIAKARNRGRDDLRGLIDRAVSAHAVALGGDLAAADRAYLRAMGAGGVNMFDDEVFGRLATIHARRKNDPIAMALFAFAAEAFADAAIDGAAAVLAGGATRNAIHAAQRRAGGHKE